MVMEYHVILIPIFIVILMSHSKHYLTFNLYEYKVIYFTTLVSV